MALKNQDSMNTFLSMKESRHTLLWLTIFAIAMAFLESVVVLYLRKIYYPHGFHFPLALISVDIFVAEFFREIATILMIVCLSVLTAKMFWQRFAIFMILFGVWDIFYYVWLKLLLNWPISLFDWDVLFLIPVPWIGPVIAPVIVSITMISAGLLILRLYARACTFKPTLLSIILTAAGIGCVLFTFIRDTNATMHFHDPVPFWFWLFAAGVILMGTGFLAAYFRLTKS